MAKSPSFDEKDVTLPEPAEEGNRVEDVETTPPFFLCARGDGACHEIGKELEAKYGITTLTVSSVRGRALTPKSFNYTTSSVRKARKEGWTKKQRLDFCQMIEAVVWKDGKEKTIQKFTGRLKDGARVDARCKGSQGSLSDPCSGNKGKSAGSCPVELVFIAGRGHLRLCETPKKGGKVLEFSDKKEALEIGRTACEFWREHGTFEGLPLAKGAPFGGVDDQAGGVDDQAGEDEDEDYLLGFKRAAEMLEPKG